MWRNSGTNDSPSPPPFFQATPHVFGHHHLFSTTTALFSLWEGDNNKNGPKQCISHRLGPRWALFLFSVFYFILTNNYLQLDYSDDDDQTATPFQPPRHLPPPPTSHRDSLVDFRPPHHLPPPPTSHNDSLVGSLALSNHQDTYHHHQRVTTTRWWDSIWTTMPPTTTNESSRLVGGFLTSPPTTTPSTTANESSQLVGGISRFSTHHVTFHPHPFFTTTAMALFWPPPHIFRNARRTDYLHLLLPYVYTQYFMWEGVSFNFLFHVLSFH